MRDTVQVLKLGIPSIVLVHEPFEYLARLQLRNLGVEDVDSVLLVYPQDQAVGDTSELVRSRAREAAKRLAPMVTEQTWGPAK